MSTADKIDDSWPHTHGTVDGFDNGCRGGSCPAGDEYGLSCKQAKSLSRNDYRYGRLVRTGATVAEIAAEFDLVGTSTPSPPKPKAAHKPKAAPKPKPAQAPVQPAAVATPAPKRRLVDGVLEATTEPTIETPTAAAAPTAHEVRQWARDRGYELPTFGRIPKHVRAHYDDAHAAGGSTPTVDEQPTDDTTEVLAAAREIREFVGPLRHEDGTINASAIAQESTLREQAGIRGWIAELDAPKDDAPAGDPASREADAPDPARPEWGYVTLQEDLQHANAATATALEERDRARDLAARLFDELHRAETTAAEHRERASAALADYLRDLGQLEQERNEAWSEQAALLIELSLARDALRTTETALDLTLRKWGTLWAENFRLRTLTTFAEGILR